MIIIVITIVDIIVSTFPDNTFILSLAILYIILTHTILYKLIIIFLFLFLFMSPFYIIIIIMDV